ncbi:MAG: prolyl oligopeptidase family serine peptidase [Candidatus Nanopelagicales bacterium]
MVDDSEAPARPTAPRLDLVDDYHGTPVPDPYRWLESPEHFPAEGADRWHGWRTRWDLEQRERYDAEAATWTMRDQFATSLRGLLSGGYQGLPVWRGERQFFSRREPGQQFGVLHTIDPDGTERALIDPMALDPSGRTTLDGFQPSWEGDRLAYLLSEGGTEESVLRVMDVATGEVIDGPIDRTRFSSVAWLPGGEAFYYVRRQDPATLSPAETQFHRRVRLHVVGTDPDTDSEIFGGGLRITNYYSVGVTPDGRWLVVDAAEGTAPRNDVYLADLADTDPHHPELRTVVERRDSQTSVMIRPDGRMFVWTDEDAPRGRLLLGDPHRPEPEHWLPLVDEQPESVLESYRCTDGPDGPDQYLLVHRTRHTVGVLELIDSRSGELVREVDVPGLGTVAGPVGRPTGGPESWYVYTDHTTPPHVYCYDAITDRTRLWATPPGHVEVPAVATQQVTYESDDGTVVHMYVIAPDGAPAAPRPTILYGYGGFAVSLAPAYNPAALAWVKAGGVYAIANLRGGSEEGEAWHRAGMLADKQNVFDDFHAAARWLIAEGWTTPGQLCISGGSNGGLLVGAAITQHPELYGSALCTAPLLDMIRYVTSQLGATWTVEYGDPARADEFAWLWEYSPYHRVVPGTRYPAMLMMVFDNDTRTDPMHGRKMVAALQHAQAGAAPIVLRTESDVGHGARALDRSVTEASVSLAFAAAQTGLEPTAPES